MVIKNCRKRAVPLRFIDKPMEHEIAAGKCDLLWLGGRQHGGFQEKQERADLNYPCNEAEKVSLIRHWSVYFSH